VRLASPAIPGGGFPVAYATVRNVKGIVVLIRGMPVLARWSILTAVAAGVTGVIVGLVVGLFTYAPTAPFAAAEIGLPAVVAGGIVGLLAGLIMTAARRIRRHGASSL
jgi:hypothetical protein